MRSALIALLLSLAALAPRSAAAQMVLCHDVARDLVVNAMPDACKGKIVTEAEAAEIRGRRADRVRQAIKPPAAAYEDTRIAGSGTGFFVSSGGTVLTNHHVIRQCAGITVETAAGNSGKATLQISDEARDLALLKTDVQGQSVGRFRMDSTVKRSEPLVVVGYPNRGMARVQPIATTGEFAGYGPPAGTIPRFLMMGEVRRGNSGGPVLDQAGLVVGVVFAKRDTVAASKAMGAPADDIGYAIPSSVAIDFLKQNNITAATGFSSTPLGNIGLSNADAVFYSARGFVTRVVCWR